MILRSPSRLPRRQSRRGVYTLVIRLNRACRVKLARHVRLVFKRGLYLYTGSALGLGSTSLERRINRHLKKMKKEFWHIDRILACRSAEVVSVVFAVTTSKVECRLNTAILHDTRAMVPFPQIGSSDCRCESHFLKVRCSQRSIEHALRSSYEKMVLSPHVAKGQSLAGLVVADHQSAHSRRRCSQN